MRQVASITEWDHYQDLKKTDADAAAEYWKSVVGASGRAAAPIQIEERVEQLGDQGWTPGQNMNAAQLQFLQYALQLPYAYGGQIPTPGEEKVDLGFVDEARVWSTTGRPTFLSKVGKLDEILTALGESDSISGAWVGTLVESEWFPESMKALLARDSLNTLDLIRSIVFESLRDTLGAQFTEREGDRLVAASYNIYLPEEMNRRRIMRLQQEITATAENKDRMVRHHNLGGDGTAGTGDERTFINYQNPYIMGGDPLSGHGRDTVAMAHVVLNPSDYDVLESGTMEQAIAADVGRLTEAESQRLLLELYQEVETPAVIEMRRQLDARAFPSGGVN